MLLIGGIWIFFYIQSFKVISYINEFGDALYISSYESRNYSPCLNLNLFFLFYYCNVVYNILMTCMWHV